MGTFREIKEASGMTLSALSDALGIPYRTLQDWSRGIRIPPAYVIDLIAHRLRSLGYLKEDG
jgi:transcriptional regulator with XRE-family HTH domain